MYLKEGLKRDNLNGDSLRDRFIKNIRKTIILKEELSGEEKMRKKLLEDIRKGELKVPV